LQPAAEALRWTGRRAAGAARASEDPYRSEGDILKNVHAPLVYIMGVCQAYSAGGHLFPIMYSTRNRFDAYALPE